MLSFLISTICANCAKSDSLRATGDTFRHLNPLVTALFATQEKGLGHFAIIYAQAMSTVVISRNYISKTKWKDMLTFIDAAYNNSFKYILLKPKN